MKSSWSYPLDLDRDSQVEPRKKGKSEPRDGSYGRALTFSGHETFVFRYGWLKKAVDAVRESPSVFTSAKAMVVLGVGKNMVRSIRHWALATRVLEEEPTTRGRELRSTAFGEFLFGPGGVDPYLEDVNSLWLLHWNLTTNEQRSTTWCWAFSLLSSPEFSRDTLTELIGAEIQRRAIKPQSSNSLRRDIECFLRTYTSSRNVKESVLEDSLDCPLVELNLMEEEPGSGLFHFRRGLQSSLADEVFVWALLQFWEWVSPHQESLSFSEVAYGFRSPGCVFKMDENSLGERLERLERISDGCLVYAETGGLQQIYRRGRIDVFALIERRYQESDPRIQVEA
jgi:hypothetical protein